MGWNPFKSAEKAVKKTVNYVVNPFYGQAKDLYDTAKKYLLPDQSNPNIETDNLRSDDFLEVLLGLCEGPIVGLEKGEESFYIGDTPLKNLDGTKNFENYDLDVKLGDAIEDETVTLKMGGVATGTTYNREISTSEEDRISENSWFATFTTSTADIDEIDVRIRIDALYSADDDGSVNKATANFRIEYKKHSESESAWTKFSGNDLYVKGKTTSVYYRDYNIPVERDNTAEEKYDIRVTRLSPKSSDSNTGYFFKFFVNQIEEVSKVSGEFKNTALAQVNIRTSEQISSIPQMYGIYKLLEVKVPSNYDPETHTYNGLWDGTFKRAWTDNPAWCLYDLIVNTRYGVNAYYEVTPDKWDFYEAGKYCDEMVDDGKGGVEPRYTLNYLITESQSGPDMLNQIASTFNAIVYEDSTGLARLSVQDNEKSAVQIYNPANITSEGFTYSCSDPSTRYNDFTVTFLNPELNWEEDRRRVTTPYGDENINLYGRIPYDFNAIGCIKESEALRKARFMLISSLKETMTVTFTTNRSAMNVNLFDIILIADPDMGYSQTGRIKSISEDRSTVYLRDPVYLESGRSAYEFQIQTPYNVFKCNVINEEVGKKVTELQLDNTLPYRVEYKEETGKYETISLIDEKAVFTLVAPSITDENGNEVKSSYGSPKPFRVMSISENQGDPDQVTITALEVHRLKQYEADNNIELEGEEYNTAPNINIIPNVLEVYFNEYFDVDRLENALQIGVNLDWESYPYYRGDFAVCSRLKGSEDPNFYIEDLEGDTIYGHAPGLYEFKILPYNTLGQTALFDRDINSTPSYIIKNSIPFSSGWLSDKPKGEPFTPEEGKVYVILTKREDGVKDVCEYFKKTYVWDNNDGQYKEVYVDDIPIFEFNISEVAAEPPADVGNFLATGNVENIHLTWDKVEGAVRYEIRLGENWDTADIIDANVTVEEYYYTKANTENQYAFLIKAVNVAGLYSEYASLAYGRLTGPSDVCKFYVTPNLDSLRFDWVAENENYVQYEVRTGTVDKNNTPNWDSATKLFVASGDNQTVLNPGFNEDTYFFIKGISRKGVYSENALWAKIKQNLKQNRNVVLKVDNAAGEIDYFIDSPQQSSQSLTPWYGVSKGLVDFPITSGGVTEIIKAMVDGYVNAEHFFPVHIPNDKNEDTIARNWYESEFFKFGDMLKWEDLVWAWNSEEAQSTSWLNEDNAVDLGGSIDTYITTAKSSSAYRNYLGFRFNETTTDISGDVTPANSYKVQYIDGKYDKGLAIYKAMKLNYNLADFSSTFSIRFKVYLNPSIPNYIKLVRICDSTQTNFIDVYFEDSQIKVLRSDGVSVSGPFNNQSYIDYMFVMLTQTEDKLYLDYFIEYANIQNRLEVDCTPLTTFTKLYFGGRYD